LKPLVSILIPAYNAEETIVYTLESAVGQTWPNKEIIVVDDGSTDHTAEIVRRFVPKVTVVSTKNNGLSGAVNNAYRLSRGDYIQHLDADDLLAPDKIERQLAALKEGDSRRLLLCSPWARFYYRTSRTHYVYNSLCQDLSPVEWLLRKMGENLFMAGSSWLVSRELAEAAGPWNTDLHFDQDGEYFVRILMASVGTRFVPKTGAYYRASGTGRVSYIGNSDKKKDSLLLTLKLHIRYLRSLEESERVRITCLKFLKNWYDVLYPERKDLVAELKSMAAQLRGQLEEPRLRWKYAWIKPVFGWKAAKWTQDALPGLKHLCIRHYDKAMYRLERG
jgi:glycosyltransferase involved in cell wall biosynthesis